MVPLILLLYQRIPFHLFWCIVLYLVKAWSLEAVSPVSSSSTVSHSAHSSRAFFSFRADVQASSTALEATACVHADEYSLALLVFQVVWLVCLPFFLLKVNILTEVGVFTLLRCKFFMVERKRTEKIFSIYHRAPQVPVCTAQGVWSKKLVFLHLIRNVFSVWWSLGELWCHVPMILQLATILALQNTDIFRVWFPVMILGGFLGFFPQLSRVHFHSHTHISLDEIRSCKLMRVSFGYAIFTSPSTESFRWILYAFCSDNGECSACFIFSLLL